MAKRTRPAEAAESSTSARPARPKSTRGAPSGEPSEEEIRRRAYQRYLERGGGHGLDFEDWVEAERELKKK